MTLNSLDIQNKSFNPKWRGFDKREVDEFLDIVVRDYDEFAQTIKDQERELKTLRERVKYFDDMKDSLNKSIVVAQDAADNLRTQAQNEANNIITDAGQKSQLIIEAAKKEAGSILNVASDDARHLVRDTDDLKRKMRLYHQRMTSIIENQLASVQSEDWVEILQPVSGEYLFNPEEKLQEILENTNNHFEGSTKSLENSDEAEKTSEVTEQPETVEPVIEPEPVEAEQPSFEPFTNAESTEEIFPELATTPELPVADEANDKLDDEATIDLGSELSELKEHE